MQLTNNLRDVILFKKELIVAYSVKTPQIWFFSSKRQNIKPGVALSQSCNKYVNIFSIPFK